MKLCNKTLNSQRDRKNNGEERKRGGREEFIQESAIREPPRLKGRSEFQPSNRGGAWEKGGDQEVSFLQLEGAASTENGQNRKDARRTVCRGGKERNVGLPQEGGSVGERRD